MPMRSRAASSCGTRAPPGSRGPRRRLPGARADRIGRRSSDGLKDNQSMATASEQANPHQLSGEGGDEGLTFGAVLGATIGNMLEFYDFVTYSFFATQIGHTFFPSKSEFASLLLSLATFGAGFITRPIGAVVIGSYSDRAGRRPAMILSFAMMGIAILVLAITPSYEAIGIAAPIIVIVARLAQGFSLGGEVGPTTAYLMEAASAKHRGLAVSFQPA